MLQSFRTKLTGYFPPPPGGYATIEEAKMEGGAEDCHGNPLHTLQDAAIGISPYCSVAAAQGVFAYGTHLCIPSINEALGKQIDFRVVDVGSPKLFQGRNHLDICVANRDCSEEIMVNRDDVLVVVQVETTPFHKGEIS